jgi:hypothetical protein
LLFRPPFGSGCQRQAIEAALLHAFWHQTSVFYEVGNRVAVLFRGAQSGDEPSAVPNLDGMAGDQPFCSFDCLGVIGTKQWFESGKVPVWSDHIRSIFCHRSIQRLQFTGKKRGDFW